MTKIAITGGIASGKSTLSQILKNKGYKVYDADKIYADLLKEEKIVKQISRLVGVPYEESNGTIFLNRKKIAEKVFSDKEALSRLNLFTHGLVYDKILEIFKEIKTGEPIFFEIPLLFESKKEDLFDDVIVVKRNLEDRIVSAINRSGLSREEVVKRIENQIDYDNFDFTKHTVIYNDGDVDKLRCEVEKILKRYEQ